MARVSLGLCPTRPLVGLVYNKISGVRHEIKFRPSKQDASHAIMLVSLQRQTTCSVCHECTSDYSLTMSKLIPMFHHVRQTHLRGTHEHGLLICNWPVQRATG